MLTTQVRSIEKIDVVAVALLLLPTGARRRINSVRFRVTVAICRPLVVAQFVTVATLVGLIDGKSQGERMIVRRLVAPASVSFPIRHVFARRAYDVKLQIERRQNRIRYSTENQQKLGIVRCAKKLNFVCSSLPNIQLSSSNPCIN